MSDERAARAFAENAARSGCVLVPREDVEALIAQAEELVETAEDEAAKAEATRILLALRKCLVVH